MRIRLYIDEDAMSRPLVNGLRARGIDVITVAEEKRRGLNDELQLEFATRQGRVLCTSNIGDFYRLHTEYLRQGKAHAGIIFIPQQRYGVGEQIRRLLKLISTKSAETMQSQVEFLSAW
jgi:hypothetical protein